MAPELTLKPVVPVTVEVSWTSVPSAVGLVSVTSASAPLRTIVATVGVAAETLNGSQELSAAGKVIFTELKNLCVWNKSNAGMGSFYRSKHELVFVFKKGTAPHVNSFGLGETGRPRSNVWDYPGVSSIGPSRMEELAMHPTVKPTRLVADAIKDCSRRGDLVLDPFGGSGTTLIAAEKTGRSARLIEYDPAYCDTILRRFERVTGKQAMLLATGETFEDVEQHRGSVALSKASAA